MLKTREKTLQIYQVYERFGLGMAPSCALFYQAKVVH